MRARNLVPTRTHNLLALAAELHAAGIPTPHTPSELAVLTPYAVTLRYDDEDAKIVTADQARQLVDAILAWAERQLA